MTVETWRDPYAKGGETTGERCQSVSPEPFTAQCVREAGHEGSHRYTSAADGRSIDWQDV